MSDKFVIAGLGFDPKHCCYVHCRCRLFVSATFTRGQRLRIRCPIRRAFNLPTRKRTRACCQV